MTATVDTFIDEAADAVIGALPLSFIDAHALDFVAAVIDAGWTVEEAVKYADLAGLLPSSPRDQKIMEARAKTVATPWDTLIAAARASLAPDSGRVQGDHLERMEDAEGALKELRAALVAAVESVDDFDDFSDLSDEPLAVTYAPGDLAYRAVYGTGLTTFAGQGDSGKSTVAQAIALDALRAGHTVVHLDYEQGKAESVSKYIQLGSSLDELRGSLIHKWCERDPLDRLVRIHSAHPERPLFVVIDSFSKAATASGLGNVDWAGHGALVSGFNAFGVDARCPALMIDHQSGGDSSTEKYASGAASKFDAASAQWTVSVSKANRFSEDRLGRIDMTNTKARWGGLDATSAVAVGGDGPDVIRPRRVGKGEVAVTQLDRDIVSFIADNGTVTKGDIEKGVRGGTPAIRVALERLVKDKTVSTVPGARHPKYSVDSEG